MPIALQHFKNLSTKEKIDYLHSNGTGVLGFLKKPTEELSGIELDRLLEIVEASAKAIGSFKTFSIKDLEKKTKEIFDKNFTGDLEQFKDNSFKLFKDTVIEGAAKTFPKIYEEIEHGKNILLDGLATSGFIDLLDGVIAFRKTVDEMFPGLADQIIAAAGNAIIIAITAYCPIAGMALKASGIVEKAQELLSCENLQKASDSLKGRLETISQQKQLGELYQTGQEIVKLSETTSIPIESIPIPSRSKQDLIGKVLGYTEFIPASQKEVDDKLYPIKLAVDKVLQEKSLPEPAKKQLQQNIDKIFEEVRQTLGKTLAPNTKFFDKVATITKAADILLDVAKLCERTLPKTPEGQKAAANISAELNKKISEKIKGPLTELIIETKKNLDLAKKLGLNFQTELVIARSTAQSQSLIR